MISLRLQRKLTDQIWFQERASSGARFFEQINLFLQDKKAKQECRI